MLSLLWSGSQRSHTWKEQKAPTVVGKQTEYARVSLMVMLAHVPHLVVHSFDYVLELRYSSVTRALWPDSRPLVRSTMSAAPPVVWASWGVGRG